MLSDARCPRVPGHARALRAQTGYSTQRYSSGRPRTGVVYGLCAQCALMIEDVALMLEADEADRAEVLVAIDRARRARAVFDRGYGDKPAAMSTLAGAFRALRRGVPGVEPWDPHALWGWLEKGTARRHEPRLRALPPHRVEQQWAGRSVRRDGGPRRLGSRAPGGVRRVRTRPWSS